FVYAHPLPPAVQGEGSPANIYFPQDSSGKNLGPNYAAFATLFYPGTRDQQKAQAVPVAAGLTKPGVDFNVVPLNFSAVSSVRTYGFSQTNVALPSPPLPVGTKAPVAAT